MIMTSFPLRILLVTRDFTLITEICNIAQGMKIFCEICCNSNSALKRLCKSKFEAILIDYAGEQEAARILAAVQNSTAHSTAVTLGIVETTQRSEATRAGLHFVLTRPLDVRTVRRTLRTAYPLLIQERRRYFRADIAADVVLQSEGCGRIRATSVNVSEGGMAVHCDRSLAMGAKFAVDFRLPGILQPLELDAEVCWTKENIAGLQFRRVPTNILTLLISWLTRRMQEAIPDLAGTLAHRSTKSDTR